MPEQVPHLHGRLATRFKYVSCSQSPVAQWDRIVKVPGPEIHRNGVGCFSTENLTTIFECVNFRNTICVIYFSVYIYEECVRNIPAIKCKIDM